MKAAMLPENASLFTRIKTGVQALQVLKDDAGDPVYGPLLAACLDTGTYKRRLKTLRATAQGAKLLESRPSLQGPELRLDQLEKFPPGTLGHEFARYFRDNKLEPFVTTFDVNTDLDFMSKRFREVHDLMHVVTGYATDTLGEMELQAFLLANFKAPSCALVLAFASPLFLKHRTLSVAEYFKRLAVAFRRGMRSRDLFTIPYEEHWETPVSLLSSQYCASA